ncbi:translation initiation factor IF-3 [Candidatus Woesebacteria bacterium]|nr:translation initiation factor IF-3 [Candidatus Woesebacteria bacterium]
MALGKKKRIKRRETYWRTNQNIRAPRLRVIDSENKQLGIFTFEEALKRAQKDGLDLVEIAAKANPPVAKIIDFAKFKYQQEKRERESRRKERRGTDQKEIWLTPFMGDNDYQVRLGRIKEFLGEGHKVRVTVRFKGRQMGHKEFGYKMTKKVVEDTKNTARVDQQPKFLGRQLLMTITPSTESKKEEKSETKEDKVKQSLS